MQATVRYRKLVVERITSMHNKPKTCDDLRSRLVRAFRVKTLKTINPGTFLNKYFNLLYIVEQKKNHIY